MPADPAVIAWDARKGLPFKDASVNVVYHSHVLEHFTRENGARFLNECHRILMPGGVLRVVVPDLQRIVRCYLDALEGAMRGDANARLRYEWIILELYDQAVRVEPGGQMAKYLRQRSIPVREFVLERMGSEASLLMAAGDEPMEAAPRRQTSFVAKAWRALRRPSEWRRILVQYILRKEYECYRIGEFRSQGEVHLWMYDEWSLRKAIEDAGFADIAKTGAVESRIPNWPQFSLDAGSDGMSYKPDSLYMEASVP